MHLYEWDGKVLKDGEVLDGPKGVVHALAFSADGKYLAAGDVRTYSVQSQVSRARMINFSPSIVRWKNCLVQRPRKEGVPHPSYTLTQTSSNSKQNQPLPTQ